jgi:hypothetical protein
MMKQTQPFSIKKWVKDSEGKWKILEEMRHAPYTGSWIQRNDALNGENVMGTVRYTVVNGQVIAENRNGVRKTYVPDPSGSTIALLDDKRERVGSSKR